jgi:pimeloyl-ACP methyl ester carboxylesterase
MTIDEGDVFRPQRVSQDRAPLAMLRETELQTEFGVAPTHSLETFGGLEVAVTRAARSDSGPQTPLILSCSGNASDRVNTGTNYAAKLLPHGDAVLFDYPGYGDSPGAASVANLQTLTPDLVKWIEAQAGDRPLIFWGHSLGGFICAELAAASRGVDAIILETTARNVQEIAKAWKPWWAPVRLRPDPGLMSFDTADALSGFPGPVLIIGAGRDSVLPVKLHRDLASAVAAPLARYIELPEATHYSAGFDPLTVEAVQNLVADLNR